jgi:hypothetical protein
VPIPANAVTVINPSVMPTGTEQFETVLTD